jgi:hypothetical protein
MSDVLRPEDIDVRLLARLNAEAVRRYESLTHDARSGAAGSQIMLAVLDCGLGVRLHDCVGSLPA